MRDVEFLSGYTVTDDGHIYSLNYGNTGQKKELAGYKDKDGYVVVLIKKKKYKRYRIVAQTFVPNVNNLPMVNHKDAVRSNDDYTNLEWCDNTYNIRYAVDHGSFDHISNCIEQVDFTSGKTIAIYKSAREAERQTGVKRPNIVACINGHAKSAGGFIWKKVR